MPSLLFAHAPIIPQPLSKLSQEILEWTFLKAYLSNRASGNNKLARIEIKYFFDEKGHIAGLRIIRHLPFWPDDRKKDLSMPEFLELFPASMRPTIQQEADMEKRYSFSVALMGTPPILCVVGLIGMLGTLMVGLLSLHPAPLFNSLFTLIPAAITILAFSVAAAMLLLNQKERVLQKTDFKSGEFDTMLQQARKSFSLTSHPLDQEAELRKLGIPPEQYEAAKTFVDQLRADSSHASDEVGAVAASSPMAMVLGGVA